MRRAPEFLLRCHNDRPACMCRPHTAHTTHPPAAPAHHCCCRWAGVPVNHILSSRRTPDFQLMPSLLILPTPPFQGNEHPTPRVVTLKKHWMRTEYPWCSPQEQESPQLCLGLWSVLTRCCFLRFLKPGQNYPPIYSLFKDLSSNSLRNQKQAFNTI